MPLLIKNNTFFTKILCPIIQIYTTMIYNSIITSPYPFFTATAHFSAILYKTAIIYSKICMVFYTKVRHPCHAVNINTQNWVKSKSPVNKSLEQSLKESFLLIVYKILHFTTFMSGH